MQTRARAGWTCRHSVSIMTHVTSVTRVICMTHHDSSMQSNLRPTWARIKPNQEIGPAMKTYGVQYFTPTLGKRTGVLEMTGGLGLRML